MKRKTLLAFALFLTLGGAWTVFSGQDEDARALFEKCEKLKIQEEALGKEINAVIARQKKTEKQIENLEFVKAKEEEVLKKNKK